MKALFGIRTVVIALLFMGVSTSVSAQDQEPHPFWSNVRFGGGIGLSFGNGFFSGTLAPSAIYEFHPQFAMGVGLNGTYNSFRNNYNSTIIGGSVLALYNVIPELQLSAEFEQLNVSRNYDSILGLEDENYWYPALFLGVGFRNGPVTVGVRYDVLFDSNRSVYADAYIPFVRVFF